MSLRVFVAAILLTALIVSQGVEQGTEGRYKTPGLISDLSKIAAGGMFSAAGLAALERIASRRRDKKPKKRVKK